MSVIKEENILKNIPLSIVKAGQIVEVEEDGKVKYYVVIFGGQERRLVEVVMHSWRSVNIHDVEQPNIIKVFDNKAKGKCIYIKKCVYDAMQDIDESEYER